jgi:hypothetical protein
MGYMELRQLASNILRKVPKLSQNVKQLYWLQYYQIPENGLQQHLLDILSKEAMESKQEWVELLCHKKSLLCW